MMPWRRLAAWVPDIITYACRVGILVLERLSDWDEKMDHLSAAAMASVRMDHAAVMGGAGGANDKIAIGVLTFRRSVHPGN